MKTNLLAILSVTAFAAMNVMATDALLSPRAADQLPRTAPHAVSDPNLAAIRLTAVPPRLLDSQIKTVSGKSDVVNPSLQCTRHMAGTPKAISACADHPGADMPCCSVAATK